MRTITVTARICWLPVRKPTNPWYRWRLPYIVQDHGQISNDGRPYHLFGTTTLLTREHVVIAMDLSAPVPSKLSIALQRQKVSQTGPTSIVRSR